MIKKQEQINPVGLRWVRILKGISQDDLARECGFDRSLISRAERGYPVSRRIKSKISAVLEMPERTLFPGVEE